jgi:hypothetical protein
MLGDILRFPLDKFVKYAFIRENLRPGLLIFQSEESKRLYLPLFRECTAIIQNVSPKASKALAHLEVFPIEIARKARINPISHNVIIPCLSLDEISSDRRKYYLCFLLVYCATCIKLFRKYPRAYVCESPRVMVLALKPALRVLNLCGVTPYVGELRRLGFDGE